jgi:hypothetical protein
MKEKKAMGRPKKYNEAMRDITLHIKLSNMAFIDRLEGASKSEKINRLLDNLRQSEV